MLLTETNNRTQPLTAAVLLSTALLLCSTASHAGLLGKLLKGTSGETSTTINGGGVTSETTLNLNLGGILNPEPVTLLSFGMSFKGWVTMLGRDGVPFRNSNFINEPPYFGHRTPVNGNMVFNVTTQGLVGTASFEPFLFINNVAAGRDISFVPAHTVLGGILPTDTLLLGNMAFDFGSIKGIPVSVVLDIGNLTSALQNSSEGDLLKGILLAESDNTVVQDGTDLRMGRVLVATTAWNTTDVDTDGDGQPGPLKLRDNPSGTTPLLQDFAMDFTNGDIGIGGSPMRTFPFVGFSPNFDIYEVTVTCIGTALFTCDDAQPIPALPLTANPLDPLLDSLGL